MIDASTVVYIIQLVFKYSNILHGRGVANRPTILWRSGWARSRAYVYTRVMYYGYVICV